MDRKIHPFVPSVMRKGKSQHANRRLRSQLLVFWDPGGLRFLFGVALSIWVFPKIGVPENGWFISWKTLLKWDDLGVPLFLKTPI